MNNMTTEHILINTANSTNRTVQELRERLIIALTEIKELTTPNPDEIAIKWCVDDVYMLAEQRDMPQPTLEQARAVLDNGMPLS